MLDSYDDILSRIPEPPDWWDVYGCPRWGEPSFPPLMGRIRCQACHMEFRVCLATPVYAIDLTRVLLRSSTPGGEWPVISDGNIAADGNGGYRLEEYWHYGDPPRHDCVGDTMSSEPEWEWEEED